MAWAPPGALPGQIPAWPRAARVPAGGRPCSVPSTAPRRPTARGRRTRTRSIYGDLNALRDDRRRRAHQCRRKRPAGRTPHRFCPWTRQFVPGVGRGGGRSRTRRPLSLDSVRSARPRSFRHRSQAGAAHGGLHRRRRTRTRRSRRRGHTGRVGGRGTAIRHRLPALPLDARRGDPRAYHRRHRRRRPDLRRSRRPGRSGIRRASVPSTFPTPATHCPSANPTASPGSCSTSSHPTTYGGRGPTGRVVGGHARSKGSPEIEPAQPTDDPNTRPLARRRRQVRGKPRRGAHT